MYAPTAMVPSAADEVTAYLAEQHQFYPHLATRDGLHAYDGRAPDFSRAAIRHRVAALELWGRRLCAAYPDLTTLMTATPLPSQEAADLALVEYARVYELFRWRDWRLYETDPCFYQSALDVSLYVKRPYAPLAERLAALTRHLACVPDVLAAARANLRVPLSRPATEQAMRAYTALGEYYTTGLLAVCQDMPADRTTRDALYRAVTTAAAAIEEFIAYLREQLAEPGGEFRLGTETLTEMIRSGELVDIPLQRLRALALADLAANRARAEELAGRLGLSLAEAFGNRGRERSPECDILVAAAATIAELRAHLVDSGVVNMELASTAFCRVARTPSFIGAGSAFMDAPGPFERPGLLAQFYVTLPDPAWPVEVRDDWLVKLHPCGLRNTAAHEVYPGHLLQFLHLGHHPSNAARALTSYAGVEGWAHYAEQLLIEADIAHGNPRAELAQLNMALLRDCRLLVALDLHAGAVTLPEAADFIAAHTHLPPIRCRQEALRGAQDPGYLNYTLGKLMLLKLRSDYARQEGQRYSLRRFHDALLSCGAPPLPLARRMLLADPSEPAL